MSEKAISGNGRPKGNTFSWRLAATANQHVAAGEISEGEIRFNGLIANKMKDPEFRKKAIQRFIRNLT